MEEGAAEAMESLALVLLAKICPWPEKGCPPSARQTQQDRAYSGAKIACSLHDYSDSVGPDVQLLLSYEL